MSTLFDRTGARIASVDRTVATPATASPAPASNTPSRFDADFFRLDPDMREKVTELAARARAIDLARNGNEWSSSRSWWSAVLIVHHKTVAPLDFAGFEALGDTRLYRQLCAMRHAFSNPAANSQAIRA